MGSASAIAHLLWIHLLPWLMFRAVTGLSLSVMFVVAESWLNSSSTSHNRGRAAGAIVIYYGVGNVIGPILASQFMRWVGPTGLFLSITLVLGVLITFVLVRMVLFPAVPKRRNRYRLYPRTTASAFQLLRRARGRRQTPASGRRATP